MQGVVLRHQLLDLLRGSASHHATQDTRAGLDRQHPAANRIRLTALQTTLRMGLRTKWDPHQKASTQECVQHS
jgi:hypothetical protein